MCAVQVEAQLNCTVSKYVRKESIVYFLIQKYGVYLFHLISYNYTKHDCMIFLFFFFPHFLHLELLIAFLT